MSDALKHECGIALIIKQTLEFYKKMGCFLRNTKMYLHGKAATAGKMVGLF
jgi:hypothetical protein